MPRCEPISPRRQQEVEQHSQFFMDSMDRGEIRGEIHAAIPGLFGAGLSHLEDPVREVLSMENGWMFFQVGYQWKL